MNTSWWAWRGLLILPVLWLGVFFVLPLGLLVVYSFLTHQGYGNVLWQWTGENYLRLLNPTYGEILLRSVGLALGTTLVCLVLGYPLALWLVSQPRPWRTVLLLLVIIPFWTNFLVRTYAWMVLLGHRGVINALLMGLGIISEPLNLLFTPFAVWIGLVYGFLPFMILPLYSTLEKFDFNLVLAAQDLGANFWQVCYRVLIPLSLRGMGVGCLLVFIPAVGAFVTPDILGGAKSLMVGNLVQNQFLKTLDWPLGAALSVVLMGLILLPIWLYLRLGEAGNRMNFSG
ncbi:binding-protein-dependent transport systems inner membrane component [Gloeomargarita lithophora Alchichica-D10]|uniref:Binding-protein-dependent transport systems inner membrane component n=1 Tax=Gloeomargarita lithophora Alchichica-D10 TaxID=1188229 RepID=A0A1J0AHC8_9CYAN|nr:ABC transporter permease [Gloeomargarita lithophora]APB35304.1 binding-protein-dependent transport systems inner membrane component [Gloeomargarita lithophora Alchichica-D10]